MAERDILVIPMTTIPSWAVLERRLFDTVEESWRVFAEKFTEADGRLRFDRGFEGSRDGVDDFYEAFFNWPAFYSLGGSREILDAAKHHWAGVTAQLTEAGMLTDEFENGYDWFHQGESLIFFYALCAADPLDAEFRERARRFAELYTDARGGNYDVESNTIAAPHNGARGLLDGLGPEWLSYPASQEYMRPYGLPLEYLPGISGWSDLEDPAKADAMGDAMQVVLGAGDVPINLASTSLVLNRWLYDGDEPSERWIARYVDGWRARAADNDGLIPDNVSPDGRAGGMHDGRWFGGHYGWTWPHGLLSVEMGALIGAMNAAFVTGDNSYLDLARTPLDTVLEHAITASVDDTPMSIQSGWQDRLGAASAEPALLVPHRFGKDGWFDFGPMPMSMPMWLWWFSREDADRERLDRVIAGSVESAIGFGPFRDKEEAGHERPWLAYLNGENPEYPEAALAGALGQVARRMALIEAEDPDIRTVHIHFWQQVNPVVTEVLTQLVAGAPQVLYNGGIPFAALSYEDADEGRQGLPADVAALVRSIDGECIRLELVNLSMTQTRRVIVRPGRFGERDIVSVTSSGEAGGDYPGPSPAYRSLPGEAVQQTVEIGAAECLIELPPNHRAELTLLTRPSGRRPAFTATGTAG
ncbi:hypothetical protein EV379_0132 [Microterricola gilva]|uniref:Uncharacterized protein n=1 Tax=Microterricola gilva TaxID=393267 RepID=A0A4Q8AJ14_9MICO|nr:hypothetical protein [Microterricola gilva]RZU63843.1 hypothetical protein EV379_0132 [Microterricola gilva]